MKRRRKLSAILIASVLVAATLSSCNGTREQVVTITEKNYTYIIETASSAGIETIENARFKVLRENADYVYYISVDNTIEISRYIGTAAKVQIPAQIDGLSVTKLANQAFTATATEVIIPASVTKIAAGAFQARLSNITVDSASTTFCDIDGVLFDSAQKTLISYPLGRTDSKYELPDTTRHIAAEAFLGSMLMQVVLPDQLVAVGSRAFFGSELLSRITIPESVSSIGYEAFNATPWFAEQTDEYVIVGNQVIIKYSGPGGAIVIPEGALHLGGAFANRTDITSVTLADSISYVEGGAFIGCSALESILVNESSTTYSSQDGVLYDKLGVRLVCYPAMKAAESYVIPNSVIYIGALAFNGAKSLKCITISKSVSKIGENAFASCNALTDIKYMGSEANWNTISLLDGNDNVVQYNTTFNSAI